VHHPLGEAQRRAFGVGFVDTEMPKTLVDAQL
jgi:hypothetical protein